MSNIVLYHVGTPLPSHLEHCILKIRQYSKIPIHLITDSMCTNHDIIVHSVKDYPELNWLHNITYFSNDAMKEMWRGSCFRFFYIEQILLKHSIKNALHFDNDVLLFEKPETIIEKYENLYKKFSITAHNNEEVVAGMCYLQSSEVLRPINEFIKNELSLNPYSLYQKYDGFPNEMRLLSKSQLCEFIPILPTSVTHDERYSKNFDSLGMVFDPSSYGQYIGGTYSEKKPGWFGTHQEIGKHISKNRIQVFYEKNNPFIVVDKEKIKIANLHIHSKQTEIFL